jgi:ribosomal protein L37AE/L43A
LSYPHHYTISKKLQKCGSLGLEEVTMTSFKERYGVDPIIPTRRDLKGFTPVAGYNCSKCYSPALAHPQSSEVWGCPVCCYKALSDNFVTTEEADRLKTKELRIIKDIADQIPQD